MTKYPGTLGDITAQVTAQKSAPGLFRAPSALFLVGKNVSRASKVLESDPEKSRKASDDSRDALIRARRAIKNDSRARGMSLGNSRRLVYCAGYCAG